MQTIVEESHNTYENESFVNEDYLKTSGLVPVGDSSKLLPNTVDLAHKFNSPGAPEVVEDEVEDEYRDDDFEEDSAKSGRAPAIDI